MSPMVADCDVCYYRFGAFEEFKKHNIGPDGTLSPHKKFLCGLGLLLVYSVMRFSVSYHVLKYYTMVQIRKFIHFR